MDEPRGARFFLTFGLVAAPNKLIYFFPERRKVRSQMPDIGFTHIALPVSNLDASIEFYDSYGGMNVVHRRSSLSTPSHGVAWLSDGMRPFVIVLLEVSEVQPILHPYAHLGIACESHSELMRLCDMARTNGILIEEPIDSGPPVGVWAFLRDPDGHTLELSFGQEVGVSTEGGSKP